MNAATKQAYGFPRLHLDGEVGSRPKTFHAILKFSIWLNSLVPKHGQQGFGAVACPVLFRVCQFCSRPGERSSAHIP